MASVSTRVHFLGIGGSGLAPLARIALARGHLVSGSDQEPSARVEALRALGARVRTGAVPGPAELAAELAGVDVVVASSALGDDHPEVAAARAAGLPVRRRSDWLPELTSGYQLVAVAGSHGKTTTSAMLTLALRAAGADPTAVIGAEVPQLGGGALVGSGELFVLEADEYGGAFGALDPALAVVTNVEWEHPDLFPDEAAVRATFAAFTARVRPGGVLVACGDDPGVASVLSALAEQPGGGPRVVRYGLGDGLTWRATDVTAVDGTTGGSAGSQDLSGIPGDAPAVVTRATVLRDGEPVGTLRLALPGRHTVLNALAVLAATGELGVPVEAALSALAGYTGAARRFQRVGAADLPGAGGTVEVIDDYAHHPTEIRVTLAAARQKAAGREVWAVVEPHTYSRLAALLDDFAVSFVDADRLYVTDIYAAREHDDLGLHSADLAKRVRTPADTSYVGRAELPARLAADLPGHDVLLLTLGAGTITELGPHLLAGLTLAH
ncbi:UDP-N-acetylmuramate--L-alanine ligase [Pseudofrankia asymbiotica]|uniref:UDP-N-acetylmuramate--L-alanine ligase n=1 Tax=Pseudofrankia asymbiotica TaxID=1834516 RepID=A0A1V2IBF3_9ACTN|nr:UDP-N-acetylmuramate--L-alanine ligase [Pseudofrankia asymbiotica]ONH30484.1 UDP-N-acetylmuramate--L-alanine ligase [Pseudofrankia asymbiotica]